MQKTENWLAYMPMLVRRRALRVFFAVLKTVGYFKPSYEEVVQISRVLHVPVWKAHAIALEAAFQDLLFSLEWATLAVRPFNDLVKDAKYVSVTEDSQFDYYLNSKSLILATLHSGCYHIAIAYLIKTYFSGRRILFIKNFALSEQEFQTVDRFLKLGFDVRVFTNEAKSEFFDMLRCLKDGSVLFILSDLPKSYGKSTKVEFFDSHAYLSDGVIDLSNICKAPILFFGVRSSINGDTIFNNFILDVSNQNCNAPRTLMSEQISSFITKEIRENPHQWQMWSRFDEYFSNEES
jgi:lauroyl/myristoyl acyltransferase